MRAHDLRGTFVTLALANGRSEAWVADRTGHTTSAMINRYRRTARSATELGLGLLAPLDEAIPELAEALELPGGGSEGGTKDELTGGHEVANYLKSQEKPKWRNRQTRRTQKSTSVFQSSMKTATPQKTCRAVKPTSAIVSRFQALRGNPGAMSQKG
jgi:hypothetical protein